MLLPGMHPSSRFGTKLSDTFLVLFLGLEAVKIKETILPPFSIIIIQYGINKIPPTAALR